MSAVVKVDTRETVNSLRQAKADITRKLEAMVKGFASDVAEAASRNTLMSTEESIAKFQRLYDYREMNYGIDSIPGFHAGAWTTNLNSNFTFNSQVFDTSAVKNNAYSSISNYKLGQAVYIGAVGPGYFAIENIYTVDGIMKPTIEMIEAVYAVKLTDYFNKG